MLKRLAISLIFLTSLNYVYTQEKLGFVKIGNESFIELSTETIIKFLNESMSNWENLMKQNDYVLMDNSKGILTYSKGEIGGQIQAIAKNREGVVSIDWYDYIDKTTTITRLEKSLKSNFYTKNGNLKYYLYSDYIIGVESFEDETHLFERVLVKQK